MKKVLLWVVSFVFLPLEIVSNWWTKVDPDKKKVMDGVEFFFLMGSLLFLGIAAILAGVAVHEGSEGARAFLQFGAWLSGIGGAILLIPSYHGVRMQYLELKRKRQLDNPAT
jgi:hypothetical protein